MRNKTQIHACAGEIRLPFPATTHCVQSIPDEKWGKTPRALQVGVRVCLCQGAGGMLEVMVEQKGWQSSNETPRHQLAQGTLAPNTALQDYAVNLFNETVHGSGVRIIADHFGICTSLYHNSAHKSSQPTNHACPRPRPLLWVSSEGARDGVEWGRTLGRGKTDALHRHQQRPALNPAFVPRELAIKGEV